MNETETLLRSHDYQKVVEESPLLRRLDPVEVSAAARFEGHMAFTKANRIVQMDDNFTRRMFPKVERHVIAKTLAVHELTQHARDLRIAAELGVNERGEVALANYFELLCRQSRGEVGPLLTDGWANGAYIIGVGGGTWVVYSCLGCGGWSVGARHLDNRTGWKAGRRFVSR